MWLEIECDEEGKQSKNESSVCEAVSELEQDIALLRPI